MILGKENFKVAKLPTKDVDVSDWMGKGSLVRLKVMTASERAIFEDWSYDMDGQKVKVKRDNYRAKLLALVIVDTDNNLVFSKDKSGIESVGNLNSLMVDELYKEASRINGLSAEEVEEDVKKSEASQS